MIASIFYIWLDVYMEVTNSGFIQDLENPEE